MSAFMIVCPCCQAVYPLEAALNDVAAREAVVEAFRLTPLGDLLLTYIGMFKPPKRALAMTRTTRLLKELLPMIHDASVTRDGRIWNAPQDYWRMALTEMIEKRDKLSLPLKSHGYLLAVIVGYSNKVEAAKESKTYAHRAGHTPVGGAVLPTVDQVLGKETGRPRSVMPAEITAKFGLKQGGNDGNS